MIYFIRTFSGLLLEHFQSPRRPDTVRRSLDGNLCILAFDEGTSPAGRSDGMSQEEIQLRLGSAESEGVWWTFDV